MSVFIIVSICSLIIIYLNNQRINIEYITSEKDGNEYIVRNLPDKQEAADRLAEIRKRLLYQVIIRLIKKNSYWLDYQAIGKEFWDLNNELI